MPGPAFIRVSEYNLRRMRVLKRILDTDYEGVLRRLLELHEQGEGGVELHFDKHNISVDPEIRDKLDKHRGDMSYNDFITYLLDNYWYIIIDEYIEQNTQNTWRNNRETRERRTPRRLQAN